MHREKQSLYSKWCHRHHHIQARPQSRTLYIYIYISHYKHIRRESTNVCRAWPRLLYLTDFWRALWAVSCASWEGAPSWVLLVGIFSLLVGGKRVKTWLGGSDRCLFAFHGGSQRQMDKNEYRNNVSLSRYVNARSSFPLTCVLPQENVSPLLLIYIFHSHSPSPPPSISFLDLQILLFTHMSKCTSSSEVGFCFTSSIPFNLPLSFSLCLFLSNSSLACARSLSLSPYTVYFINFWSCFPNISYFRALSFFHEQYH